MDALSTSPASSTSAVQGSLTPAVSTSPSVTELRPQASVASPRAAESLKEKGVMVLMPQTPVIDRLEFEMKMLTAGKYVEMILNTKKDFPGADQPLYIPDFPVERTRQLFETFAKLGMQDKNWEEWFKLFADDAIYVSDDKTIHIGRVNITKDIGAQIALVPSMNYNFPIIEFHQNSVTVSSNNIMPMPDGTNLTYINISRFWFNKKGEIIAAIDTIDKGVVTEKTLTWLACNTAQGGSALSNFFEGLVKMVKTMCGCASKTKDDE
ncbi:MAG: hypothetical protein KDK62_01900 [Chlamydiia bacterium]|nr:hypothetical protein [Chlamydiia bacterium]